MNENGNGTVDNGTNGQQTAEVKQPENSGQQQVQQTAEVKQPGWFKRNWKWLTASAVAAITTTVSGIVAYKKGKQNGTVNAPNNEDYVSPLDPNV